MRDGKLYPARGQVVIVRNDPGAMVSHSGTDDGEDQVVYMMARAAGMFRHNLPGPGTLSNSYRRRYGPWRDVSTKPMGSIARSQPGN